MCVSLCLIQSLVRCPLDFRIILQNLKSIGPIVWSQSPKMHFCNIPRRTPHHAITDVISLQICLNTTSIHWHGLSSQMYHFLSDFMKLHISPVLLLGEFEKSPSMLIGTVCMYVCLFVSLFVCKQSSGHNFDPICMKFFTHISDGHISIPSTFEGQRSNIKVKVTIFVIFRFLLITSSVFVLETSNQV